jgi:ABC-type amino acid transport substrate-binding protein
VYKTSPYRIGNEYTGEPVLERIMNSGEIRIGYPDDLMPFSFFNARNELVGFNIELANTLAMDLNCVPVYYKVDADTISEALNDDHIDICISALSTPSAMQYMTFSKPYLTIHIAMIVPDYRSGEFKKLTNINSIEDLRIGLRTRDTYLLSKANILFPNAEIITIETRDDILDEEKSIDVVLCSAEDGAAWTLLHPEYNIVIPEGLNFKQTLSFGIKNEDTSWLNYLNNWIDLKKEGEQFDQFYDYWILGINPSNKSDSWSIIKDVLHWVD